MMIYDVQKNAIGEDDPLGLSGYMSWHRLARLLRECGEVGPGEELTHIVISKRGLDLRFGRAIQP